MAQETHADLGFRVFQAYRQKLLGVTEDKTAESLWGVFSIDERQAWEAAGRAAQEADAPKPGHVRVGAVVSVSPSGSYSVNGYSAPGDRRYIIEADVPVPPEADVLKGVGVDEELQRLREAFSAVMRWCPPPWTFSSDSHQAFISMNGSEYEVFVDEGDEHHVLDACALVNQAAARLGAQRPCPICGEWGALVGTDDDRLTAELRRRFHARAVGSRVMGTIEKEDELIALLGAIQLRGTTLEVLHIEYDIRQVGPGWLITPTFWRPDAETGRFGRGRGRAWFVERGATDERVVFTAWMATHQIVTHELHEAFTVVVGGRRVRLLDPHKTLEDIARGSRTVGEPALHETPKPKRRPYAKAWRWMKAAIWLALALAWWLDDRDGIIAVNTAVIIIIAADYVVERLT